MFVNDALVSSHASTKGAQAKITFTLQNWLKQSPLFGLGGGGVGGRGGILKFRIDWILFRIEYSWILLGLE